MTLSGVKDIDLLIISSLSDRDIENINSCVLLKDEPCFWKPRLLNKYKVQIDYSSCVSPISWKTIYLDYAKFFEYFNLTLFIALLKDYYCKNFSIYFLIYLSHTVQSEGFFPLLNKILVLVKNTNILNLEKILITKHEELETIQKEYLQICYEFPHKIKFGKDEFKYTNFKSDLLHFLHSRIFKSDNIFSYKIIMDCHGALNINFNCDS
jgi:hypothetical protein